MPFGEKPAAFQNIDKYGPGLSENVQDVEQFMAASEGRQPRSTDEMIGRNLLGQVGNPQYQAEAKNTMQKIREYGDQYKREARGIPDTSTLPQKMFRSLGFKHGGKVSTAEPNKKQKRW